jgi:predicted unusual protein kinase regulating ubiquinone biosynthesis (AarF/ABC1/UbiB family)
VDTPDAQQPDEIPTGRLRRGLPIAGLLARSAGEAAVSAARARAFGGERTIDHELAAERYAQLLGRSRGALMKLGQALSFVSLDGIFPVEAQGAYREALSRLREDAPPMPAAVAREVLESDLRQPVEAVFAELEWQPLAAASIGQVHRARLHDGRAVAVKIQYPSAAAAIEADLENIELLSTFMSLLSSFSPRRIGLDMRALANEMSNQIRAELDYRLEAANQRRFASFYRGHPFIHVPDVVDDLCSRRVLTQDLVEGLTFEQACIAEQALREQWAQAVLRFGQGSINTLRAVNVDPHPGNYRFHRDGTVSFLDFGSVLSISPSVSRNLTSLVRAILRSDAAGIRRAALATGVWKESDPVSEQEAFAYWHEPMVMYWGPQPFRITPEIVAAGIKRHTSPTGPSANAVRHIRAPAGFTLIRRMDLGVLSVIAGLDVALDWRAMALEFYEGQPPLSEMGRRHWQFIASQDPAIAAPPNH